MLEQFLAQAARECFAWGERDCGLFVADWVGLVTGRDPAADLRGRYRDADGAATACGCAGLAGTVARLARAAGLERTSNPAHGDIGIVTDRLGTTFCAVRCPTGWAARAERGIVVSAHSAVRVRMAWAVR